VARFEPRDNAAVLGVVLVVALGLFRRPPGAHATAPDDAA
jgi:hypothetical protein